MRQKYDILNVKYNEIIGERNKTIDEVNSAYDQINKLNLVLMNKEEQLNKSRTYSSVQQTF